ncbi:MAG: hypothetical protein A3B68_01500 [Candidatus Melainabacteria bacterium RIFCSPHIGHO2_02_FULL_34_12]|nr:MAG: hypothetical protein A3B68_01500 [Candidatus Melainabacteria bacterium RIFCSPHIGHO2_02_FULL_34_12]
MVKVFNATNSELITSFFAYPTNFTGGVRVASGDINGDDVADIITSAGPGGNSHVKVFDGNSNSEIRSFLAYPGFTGDVFVASGDVNGDGFADIITGDGTGGNSHVKVFSGTDSSLLKSFFAYAGFTGGARVASGDVNGDGFADIITGDGAGGNSHVKVFDGNSGSLLRSFFVHLDFTGGVSVASGDVNGDGFADIITGAGTGAKPIKVFDGNSNSEVNIPAYTAANGNIFVASGDVNGDGFADIITGDGPGGNKQVKVFDANLGQGLNSFPAYIGHHGDIFVAVSDGCSLSNLFHGTPTISIFGDNSATIQKGKLGTVAYLKVKAEKLDGTTECSIRSDRSLLAVRFFPRKFYLSSQELVKEISTIIKRLSSLDEEDINITVRCGEDSTADFKIKVQQK